MKRLLIIENNRPVDVVTMHNGKCIEGIFTHWWRFDEEAIAWHDTKFAEFKSRAAYETGKRKFQKDARLGSYAGLVVCPGMVGMPELTDFQRDEVKRDYETRNLTLERVASEWGISEREAGQICGCR